MMNGVLNKGKYVILPLFNSLEVLYSASGKVLLLAENISRNSNLDDSSIPLPVLHFRANMKLYKISVTPKLVKRVITNLDLPKAYGPDSIPVVVLRTVKNLIFMYSS